MYKGRGFYYTTMATYDREFSISGSSDTDDAHIKISVKSIAEYFHCPVCRCSIQETALSICGHRFCHSCIKEWVGRRHECPICRTRLQEAEIILDKHFDELIKKIVSERKKEEIEHYQRIADEASNALLTGNSMNNELVSPLEMTLRKHLKQTLSAHEAYRQQVLVEFKRSRSRSLREKQSKVDQVMRQYPHDPDHPGRVQQMNAIEKEWEEKRQLLTDELARIESLLTSAYDRYLERNLPSSDTMPVTVKLSVPEKEFAVDDIIIKPSDTMGSILKKVEELMKGHNIEVVSFPPCEELQISLLSPFAVEDGDGDGDDDDGDCGTCGGGVKSYKVGGATSEEEIGLTSLVKTTLHSDCRPILEYGLKSGSEIRIKGNIVLRGEEPKLCFAATFVKGQEKPIDYFVCSTCNNTTWICQMCAEVCHKGHELLPHKMNHTSTWPCCYCQRKKLCIISPTTKD